VKQHIFQKQNKGNIKGQNNELEANTKSKKAGIFTGSNYFKRHWLPN
jgi:hypothetical protein